MAQPQTRDQMQDRLKRALFLIKQSLLGVGLDEWRPWKTLGQRCFSTIPAGHAALTGSSHLQMIHNA